MIKKQKALIVGGSNGIGLASCNAFSKREIGFDSGQSGTGL